MPGLLAIAAITAMLALVLWVVFYGSAARLFVRRHLPGPTVPGGPPIERLVADLTRLRAATLAVPPGTSQVRRSAATAAYDDALAQACLALGLPDTLTGLPAGTDREAERLCVESLLEEAGLRFRPPQ
ncbi:hypothetical protein [Nocardioides currus]|uniref:hypothetical protein n=1 Tax=Nocardioides currus TaxID=2133958 RepID=UPI001A9C79C9|nr:hypothetical protein [Nocardioides currus]